jgi:hypothetical protein
MEFFKLLMSGNKHIRNESIQQMSRVSKISIDVTNSNGDNLGDINEPVLDSESVHVDYGFV